MDVASVDVIWNGFAQSLKIAALAETHELACAPHNYYSHLATFIAAQWCAAIPNVRLLEIDVDDVPWREELTTAVPEIRDGELVVPRWPGLGLRRPRGRARRPPGGLAGGALGGRLRVRAQPADEAGAGAAGAGGRAGARRTCRARRRPCTGSSAAARSARATRAPRARSGPPRGGARRARRRPRRRRARRRRRSRRTAGTPMAIVYACECRTAAERLVDERVARRAGRGATTPGPRSSSGRRGTGTARAPTGARRR